MSRLQQNVRSLRNGYQPAVFQLNGIFITGLTGNTFLHGISDNTAQNGTADTAQPVPADPVTALERNLDRYLTECEQNGYPYDFIVAKDYKQAWKNYNKALKIKPDDYTALKNCVLLARQQDNVKLEKKYLTRFAEIAPENEKLAAEGRLKYISGKK